jgi:hypothetical protein
MLLLGYLWLASDITGRTACSLLLLLLWCHHRLLTWRRACARLLLLGRGATALLDSRRWSTRWRSLASRRRAGALSCVI